MELEMSGIHQGRAGAIRPLESNMHLRRVMVVLDGHLLPALVGDIEENVLGGGGVLHGEKRIIIGNKY